MTPVCIVAHAPLCARTSEVIHLAVYIDLENLVQHIKFIKSMENTEPWKSGTTKALDPAPNCSTESEIRGESLHIHSISRRN